MTEATAAKPHRPTPKTPADGASLTTRARDAANDAGGRFADGVDANPLAILAGGIAVGLAVGALLPKTRIEGQYLAPLGAKLNEGARTAASAAATAGKAELTAAGLNKVGANEQFGKLLETLGAALGSAGTAARETRRRKDAADARGKA